MHVAQRALPWRDKTVLEIKEHEPRAHVGALLDLACHHLVSKLVRLDAVLHLVRMKLLLHALDLAVRRLTRCRDQLAELLLATFVRHRLQLGK